jgi:hypothetical protein
MRRFQSYRNRSEEMNIQGDNGWRHIGMLAYQAYGEEEK